MRNNVLRLTLGVFVLVSVSEAGLLDGASLDSFAAYSHELVQLNWKAKVYGDVAAWDDVRLQDQATATGDLFAGDQVKLGWKASAGDAYDNLGAGAFASLVLPEINLSAGGADKVRVQSRDELALTPGSYGDLRVDWKGKLTLTAGSYYFDSIVFADQSAITLDTSAGDVQVFVAGDTTMRWKSSVSRSGVGGALLTAGGKVRIQEEAALDASVFAGGRVNLAWKANLTGQVLSHSKVTIGDQATVGGASLAPVPEPAVMAPALLLLMLRRRG